MLVAGFPRSSYREMTHCQAMAANAPVATVQAVRLARAEGGIVSLAVAAHPSALASGGRGLERSGGVP